MQRFFIDTSSFLTQKKFTEWKQTSYRDYNGENLTSLIIWNSLVLLFNIEIWVLSCLLQCNPPPPPTFYFELSIETWHPRGDFQNINLGLFSNYWVNIIWTMRYLLFINIKWLSKICCGDTMGQRIVLRLNVNFLCVKR